jgi:hypothetical protein
MIMVVSLLHSLNNSRLLLLLLLLLLLCCWLLDLHAGNNDDSYTDY